jgi:hypothetical protein
MNICSDDHEEIVYNSNKCPLCQLEKVVQECQDEIKELTSSLEKASKELAEYE